MPKKGTHTRRQLNRERVERDAVAKAALRAERTGSKYEDRDGRKVDAALKGCKDV